MTTHHIMGYRPMNGPLSAISNRLPFHNGHTIPQLGFGTYRMPAGVAADAVTYALSCGYRHIDCAKAYQNEAAVGAALAQALRTRRTRREDLFVTSKLWPTDQHPDHVEATCRATLDALRLDHLDLYLIHWPVCMRHTATWATEDDKYPRNADGSPAIDSSVTLLDTWRAMNALVTKGLVKSIGLSNCKMHHLDELMAGAEAAKLPHAPVLNQIELHPALVDGDLVSHNNQHKLLIAAYCPLGMPTRHTPRGFQSLVEDATLAKLGEFVGFSPARILLNWNADRNNVVIVNSTNKEHIKSNARTARFALDDRSRVILDSYRMAIRRFRLINPTYFTTDQSPFFTEDDARLEHEINSRIAHMQEPLASPPPPTSKGFVSTRAVSGAGGAATMHSANQ